MGTGAGAGMKIVVAHNFYQQPGGEDQVFAAEVALLESRGHEAVRFEMHNDRVEAMSRAKLIKATIWNRDAERELGELLERHRPEVVHFHNTFPLISPAGYAAARRAGAAVVQTLHNFRLLCPNGLFLREGQVCEACLGRTVPWPAVQHGCYRESRATTAVVATALTVHRARGTYRHAVDAYIVPTEMAREKFARAKVVPEDRLHVKPHFVHPDPGVGPGDGGFAIFVGRLSREKGLGTLLAAWARLGERAAELPLKVIGDGPLAPLVREHRSPHVSWLGRLPLAEVYAQLGRAAVLVLPSECYETFGRTAVEAFATGTPVIAADHGAMAEIVEPGETGLRFRPGDAEDLAARVTEFLADRAAWQGRRPDCRREFEAKYTAERNYQMLMEVYRSALARARGEVELAVG
jgi:glycosyltransferase involved in cell wall biosynthesis